MAQPITPQLLAGSIPFKLEITNSSGNDEHKSQCVNFECQQLLRLLPGRRVVCQSEFGQQQVVIKLFIHPRKAARDYNQELNGYQLIADSDILTPELISHGKIIAGGFFVMYRYIEASRVLGETLPPTPEAAAQAQLHELMAILARMHATHCQQVDLHVNNFLYANGQLYTIDCGTISAMGKGRQQLRQRHKNLANILSQLPTTYDYLVPELLDKYRAHYSQQYLAGAPIDITTAEINRLILRWRRWRMHNYQKKVARTCSEFIADKQWHERRIMRREYSSPEWLKFYAEVDKYIAQGTVLKDGNTATVALAQCSGKKLVIKRYNIKNWRHLLSRCWRPSRGWRTWQNAHRLKVLGIQTPQPIAVIEKRWGWLRLQAYYISAYTPATDALTLYSHPQAKVSPPQLAAFRQLFNALIYARISHGDFKANNILVENNRVTLIDLDSMHFHRWRHSFSRAFAKDLDRFQRNWLNNQHIYQQFQNIIDQLEFK
ncbi:MAG: lipopolysaccharide kinase InaA family protein [Desulfuromonas sp.]|nr:lipopolysaccharide kinase InaA family protein [Desulfuromonas sp.]